jgi:hypothetical protein
MSLVLNYRYILTFHSIFACDLLEGSSTFCIVDKTVISIIIHWIKTNTLHVHVDEKKG